jgi:hypothetical protein
MKIVVGALAPKITSQLKKQGIHYNPKDIAHIQQDFDAVVRLKVRGFISDAAASKVEKCILKSLKNILTY